MIIGRLGDQPIYRSAVDEAHREEAEYKAREEASEAEWDRRLARRVAEGPVKFGGLTHTERKHYGVWHPQQGWTWAYGIVFFTESRAIAEAQRDVSRRMGLKDSDLWEVRCIEE